MVQKLPEGETMSPIFQTIGWVQDPLKYLRYCQQKYGDIFTINIGPIFRPQVLISDPEALKTLFALSYDESNSGKPANPNVDIPLIGKNGITMASGQNHQRLRNLLKPAFHGEQIKQQQEQICNLTQKIIYKYWSHWQQNKSDYILMNQVAREISTEIIFHVVLGLEENNNRQSQIKELLTEIISPQRLIINSIFFLLPFLQVDLGSLSPWGKHKREMEQLDRLIYEEIQERRITAIQGDRQHNDILTQIITVQDENGNSLSDVEIRDQIMTLLVAGSETTSTALSWSIYWTSYLEDVKTKLLNEINSSNTTQLVSKTEFPYLNAVCSETLRICPPALLGFGRIIRKPVEIADYYFEPGTILTPCIYLLHHQSQIYSNPDRFQPERFLSSTFKQHEYIPFGGGKRKCLGYTFALFEIKLVLLTIFKNWDIKLANESSPEIPVGSGVMLTPKNKVKATIQKRT